MPLTQEDLAAAHVAGKLAAGWAKTRPGFCLEAYVSAGMRAEFPGEAFPQWERFSDEEFARLREVATVEARHHLGGNHAYKGDGLDSEEKEMYCNDLLT